jgi:hypothetical protein
MSRPINKNNYLRVILGLTIVVGLGAARTEKIWAEAFNGFDLTPVHVSVLKMDHEAFDPRRVPQSGGMASRLLSGIVVKHA